AEYHDLLARLRVPIESGTVQVVVVDGQVRLQLSSDQLFTPGSATLSTRGAQTIRELTGVLVSTTGRRLQVAGHTDGVVLPADEFASHWHLGAERAIAVAQQMVESGLAADRVSAVSYAEHRP